MKQRKGKGIVIPAILIIILVSVIVSGLNQRNNDREDFTELLSNTGRWNTPDSIAELRKAIADNERRIERYVQTAAQNATYWKLLAVRLQQRGLHGDTLEALERAIYYAPEDPLLHYYNGISAGIMAKSFFLVSEDGAGRDAHRNRYFEIAESSFLRAIELDGNYLRPRYSLGVLYVFDLGRPEDAVPHLEKCLEVSRNDVDTMFVLARAFFVLQRYQEALDLYDRIIILAGDEQKRLDAQNNRQTVLGRLYG